jgi:uncharacterized protein (UPF0276 family)
MGLLTSAVNNDRESVRAVAEAASEGHWIELSARALMKPQLQEWESLSRLQKVTFYAIRSQSLNLAGLDELDFVSIKSLREVSKALNPIYFVERLGWSRKGHHETFLSLPPIYSEEVLEHVIERVFRVQELLGRTLTIENTMGFVASKLNTIEEWDFLSEICRVTGAECSLNLTYIWAQAKNFQKDAHELLTHHMALGPKLLRVQGVLQQGDLFLPSSEHSLTPELFDFSERALGLSPENVVIEVTPKLDAIKELKHKFQALQLPKIPFGKQASGAPSDLSKSQESMRPHYIPIRDPENPSSGPLNYESYQDQLLHRVTQMNGARPQILECFVATSPLVPDVGLSIYNTQYFVQLRTYFRKQFPLLIAACAGGFDRVLVQYLSECPPESADPLMVGQHLEDFFRNQPQGLPLPGNILADIACFEWAHLELATAPLRGAAEPSALTELNDSLLKKVGLNFNGLSRLVEADFDVGKLWKNHLKGKPMEPGKIEKKYFLFYRLDEKVQHLMISRAEAKAYRYFGERQPFAKVNELMLSSKEGGVTHGDQSLQMLLEFAHRWMSLGIVEGLIFNHPQVVQLEDSPWDPGTSL